jgi:hypothetical protein
MMHLRVLANSNYVRVNPDMSQFTVSRIRQSGFDKYEVSGAVRFTNKKSSSAITFSNDFSLIEAFGQTEGKIKAKLYQNGKFLCDLKAPLGKQQNIDYDKKIAEITFQVDNKGALLDERADAEYNILQVTPLDSIRFDYQKLSYVTDEVSNEFFVAGGEGKYQYYTTDPSTSEPFSGIEKPDGLFSDSDFIVLYANYTILNALTGLTRVDYRLITETAYTTSNDILPEGSGWTYWRDVQFNDFTFAQFTRRPVVGDAEFLNIGVNDYGGTIGTYLHKFNSFDSSTIRETYSLEGGRTLENVLRFLIEKTAGITSIQTGALSAVLGNVVIFQITDILPDAPLGTLNTVRATKGFLSFNTLMSYLSDLGFEWYYNEELERFILTHPLAETETASGIDFARYKGHNFVRKANNFRADTPEFTELHANIDSNIPDFFAAKIEFDKLKGFDEKVKKFGSNTFNTDLAWIFTNPDAFNDESNDIFALASVSNFTSGYVLSEISDFTGIDVLSYRLSPSYLFDNILPDLQDFTAQVNGVSKTFDIKRIARKFKRTFDVPCTDISEFEFGQTYKFITPHEITEVKQLAIESKAEITIATNDIEIPSSTLSYLRINSPNGGEVYDAGDEITITYYFENVDNVKLEYSDDNGASWNTIESSTAATGSYVWTSPSTSSTQYLIRITDVSDALVFDVSDAVFEIQGTGILLTTTKSGTFSGEISFATAQTGTVYWGDGTSTNFSGTLWSLSKSYPDTSSKDVLIISSSYDFDIFSFDNENISDIIVYSLSTIESQILVSNNALVNVDFQNLACNGQFGLFNISTLKSIFHSVLQQEIISYRVENCDYTGILNISSIKLTNIFYCFENPNLIGVNHSNIIGQQCSLYRAYRCDITGVLDLSDLKIIGDLRLYLNANLTGILFSSASGQYTTYFHAGICDLTGALDISDIKILGVFIINRNTNLDAIAHSSEAGQNINTYNAYGCNLGVIEFEKLSLNDSVNITLYDNLMTAAEVNENLVKIDNDGAINGTLDISGTNAAPDGTSGGFDGLTAVSNLTGKGWSITTS